MNLNFVKSKIGFMQGRLSELVDGKIQAFPWDEWMNEFDLADSINLRLMEWTLDQDRIDENPLMTQTGQDLILSLCNKYQIKIRSLTGDCFMQEPFWKNQGSAQESLKVNFFKVCEACNKIGINTIVIPLVDNGRIENKFQEKELVNFMLSNIDFFERYSIKIAFESDLTPIQLLKFINKFPKSIFGINYDTGNSSSLGFNPIYEIDLYGARIINVHIKDRKLGGYSVPLFHGDTNFKDIFSKLNSEGYSGNYIFQTARAKDGKHLDLLQNYFEIISSMILKYNSKNLN